MDKIKKEQWRIWNALNAILPIDDFGELKQSDEIHKIVFNTDIPIRLKRDIDFEKAVNPAIRYLLQNHNPHTKIYIDYDKAEMVEGIGCYNLSNEVPD